MQSKLVSFVAAMLLTGCASPFFDVGRTETVVPVARAWVDGRIVEYITTDISDLSMARMMGANHAPRLAEALRAAPGPSLLERVYKFSGQEQASIFQSAPLPLGAADGDQSYSPLWRVVMVQWLQPSRDRVLKSEEELLAAEQRGELRLEVTGIVVNCPITRVARGQALRGVR